MSWRHFHGLAALAACLGLAAAARAADDEPDLNDLQEKAVKEAVHQVAPCVVQISTSGGADRIVSGPRGTLVRKALGPTPGLVVGADGYIVSSAFNFVNEPKAIFVAVPGHEKPYVAKRVATDHSKMITLLKIEANGLPVPQPA